MIELSKIESNININSEKYRSTYEKMIVLLEKYKSEMSKTNYQGEEKALIKAKKENRLLPKERLELLLDQDSPFLELLPLAGWGTDCYRVGSSIIAGIGIVANKLCMIICHIGTVKGGAIDQVTLKKMHRINQIVQENDLITVNLIESSGANLTQQSEIFNYAGTVYKDLLARSKAGIPTISAVFGNTAAGGAYIASVSDHIIMVKDSSRMFLAGPPLVKMATGEKVDEETLGGSSMHSKVSGVSDYLAENEYDAIRIARELVYYYQKPQLKTTPDNEFKEPIYDSEELLGILQDDIKNSFDCIEVIARVVDGSNFSEFKKDFGITMVCGFAKIHGYTVGFVANNGVLFSESANKAAHFIQICNQNQTPIIFLHNISGFIVGQKYEEEGIIKHGAKMLNVVANSEVPHISIIIGGSYGAGNFAMSGRSMKPNFVFSYPNSRMAIMGNQQLSGVLKMINAGKDQTFIDKIIEDVEFQSSPYFATGQMWDDGIIDPRDTRTCLAFCLEVFNNHYIHKNPSYGIFRM